MIFDNSYRLGVNKYKVAGRNQHGTRYKYAERVTIKTVVLSAKADDAEGLAKLAILSERLGVPLEYNFEKQQASIELCSAKEIIKITA
jgi:hypothetical protein